MTSHKALTFYKQAKCSWHHKEIKTYPCGRLSYKICSTALTLVTN